MVHCCWCSLCSATCRQKSAVPTCSRVQQEKKKKKKKNVAGARAGAVGMSPRPYQAAMAPSAMVAGVAGVALSCLNNTPRSRVCRHGPCHVGGCIDHGLPRGGIGPRVTVSAFAAVANPAVAITRPCCNPPAALDALWDAVTASLLEVAFWCYITPGHSSPSHLHPAKSSLR